MINEYRFDVQDNIQCTCVSIILYFAALQVVLVTVRNDGLFTGPTVHCRVCHVLFCRINVLFSEVRFRILMQ